MSTGKSASVVISVPDTVAPVVTSFALPATANSLIVPIVSFTATDNTAVTGYIATESSSAPLVTAPGWSAIAPASFAFAAEGSKTLYGWAKDAAGNVSASRTATVSITIPSGPEPTGWFAGDMHVHRSCGGAPESVSGLLAKMDAENLAVISLLADMGNGEVQNPATDLPLVNGHDDAVSRPGRIVHWDAEWHWDAVYTQYPNQALGGHLVALGLSEAHQRFDEYTYPVLNWARQQGAIAGFVHMQYLDDGIPQSLDCCKPIEFPVEIALGSAALISEDVDDSSSGFNMNPESAIRAYYRLLNCGFRPALTAGTDYPCNGSRPLGSLLTYVQPANGPLSYRSWIEGIAAGRTVVSRNGHREFLNLVVNGSATPGDEVRLSGPGSVPVTVQWAATQNLTGSIELIRNGAVIAVQQSSVSAGSPATLSAAVDFSTSGWLAARRMGADGQQTQTAAVYVIVNNAPIRASAADANFFVQWMDTLLTNTSPGGVWNSYFKNNLNEAQARYRAAKTVFQQIASEAGGGNPGVGSIFTSQTPALFENDAEYELGTRLRLMSAGGLRTSGCTPTRSKAEFTT